MFNDDTRPSGHISRPTIDVEFYQLNHNQTLLNILVLGPECRKYNRFLYLFPYKHVYIMLCYVREPASLQARKDVCKLMINMINNTPIVSFHKDFSPSSVQLEHRKISSSVITTHCRLYSSVSQTLMLYKIWRYYNKFDSTKSLVVCYRCVKIPQ